MGDEEDCNDDICDECGGDLEPFDVAVRRCTDCGRLWYDR